MTGVIVVLVALSLPLVLGSVFVCVPKWWTQSVEPHIPAWLIIDTPEPSPAAQALIERVAKILTAPIVFSAALVAWMIRGWFMVGLAVIEGACPYTSSFEWRECLSEWFDVGKIPLTDLSDSDVLGFSDDS